ncbi:MAG: potassium transporter [Gammaproteobacteria bacterium]|nr:potassium transporter [Gammaproteobacteria bacterium]
MSVLIPVLLAAVALATVVNVALKRFNIPTVIGYILTGAIIGPLFGIEADGHEALDGLAEFGIVFLMFTIGLEFSLSHLLGMKREVLLFGTLQVMVTGALFCLIAVVLFGLDDKPAIIVSAGLALSSTAIVLKILNETGQIKLAHGRYSLGILLFQDLAVIPILLMITIFSSNDRSLGDLLLETLIHAVIAVGILVLVGKYVLGHIFKAVSRAKSKEIYMGFVLLTVVSASVLAHAFGFSYSLGGFIAGMMIAETIYKYQVEADLVPFRDLLLGVFFFTVGLQIDLGVVAANLGIVILLSIGIMLIKAFILFGLLAFSAGPAVALRTAISLSQVGEFTLVLFSLLAANALLDSLSVQLLILAVVISMIVTPLVINHAEQLIQWLFRRRALTEPMMPSSLVGGHLILCGYGDFGRVLSDRLDQAGIDHLIVTDNTDDYKFST